MLIGTHTDKYPAVPIEYVIDNPGRPRRAPHGCGSRTSMRVVKHEKQVNCPWCKAGSTMTFRDASGEYCMACKKDLETGKLMERKPR